MDLPKVKIGGEDIALPAIMNFATLERAWPALKAIEAQDDPIGRISSSLAFLAAVLLPSRPDLNLQTLKERLRIKRFNPDTGEPDGEDERPGIAAAVRQLCLASGLISSKPDEGEEAPPGDGAAPAAPATGPSKEAISPT